MSEQATAADGCSAGWAVLLAKRSQGGACLHLFVVFVDAVFAKLVKARPHLLRLFVHARTDLALQLVLEPLEKVLVDDLVAVVVLWGQHAGVCTLEEEAS